MLRYTRDMTPFAMAKKPSKQYPFLLPLIWLAAFWDTRKLGLKIDKVGMKGIKPPYLVIATHQGLADYSAAPLATVVQGLRDAAVIIRCNNEEDAQGEKLYLAFLKLDPSNVVFILDSGAEVPFALSQLVLQTIRFKPYSDAELFAIYRQKLKELGSSLNISPECEKKSLGRLSSSLDAVRIARETHFRHLLFCQSGKASRAEIGEREFERLLRELFPPLKEASKKAEDEN